MAKPKLPKREPKSAQPPIAFKDKSIYQKRELPTFIQDSKIFTESEMEILKRSGLEISPGSDFSNFPSLDKSPEMFEKLVGNYQGQAVWQNNHTIGEAMLSISGSITAEKHLEGLYEIKIFENGDLRAHVTNPGDIGQTMRLVDDENQSIIIEPRGRDGRQKFQLFLRQEGEKFFLAGSIYFSRPNDPQKFVNAAVIKLEKQ